MDQIMFHRSSFCTDGGQCVEVGEAEGGIHVRDSKDPSLAWLGFDAAEWRAFVTGLRSADFDR